MLSEGMTPEDIVRRALKNFEVEVLYEQETEYKCNCSKQRIEKALLSMGKKELHDMAEEMDEAEIECHFCDKKYVFTKRELKALEKN